MDTADSLNQDASRALSPARSLAVASNGVREAARRLTRVSVRLERPRKVLVVTKPDDSLVGNTRHVANYFLQRSKSNSDFCVTVYIEDKILAHPGFHGPTPLPLPNSCVKPWNTDELLQQTNQMENDPDLDSISDASPRAENIDFVITLGGDGTVLYASYLFQGLVPPILPFSLGTLGFLTVFDFSACQQVLDQILGAPDLRLGDGSSGLTPVKDESFFVPSHRHKVPPLNQVGLRIVLRMRLACRLYRKKNGSSQKPDTEFHILNDLVVDRGPSPSMALLEIFGNEQHLTSVQADGLVISTPTGSTAYSLSAGGSMVHPEVPALLLTPICPHTLSFRPMLLPDSMELKIVLPEDSRNVCWASFDGRNRTALEPGDILIITSSQYPVPTLCNLNQTQDWFESLVRCLGWNERMTKRQKKYALRTADPDTDKQSNL